MMKTYKHDKYDLLKMQHARLVTEITMYAAVANRETASGGWQCDWFEAMLTCSRAAEAIEDEINATRRLNHPSAWDSA